MDKSLRAHRQSQRFAFIVMPDFALLSWASATEPLRAANTLAGKPLYQWRLFGNHDRPPGQSPAFQTEMASLAELERSSHEYDAVFVCASGQPVQWDDPAVPQCLRRLAAQGVRVGGISGGAYLLAKAGLLDGRQFTIHWEYMPALAEAFGHLTPQLARYVLDGDRLTSAGGVAVLDMMHALIRQRHGQAFATLVSDWFLHHHVELPDAPQRASLAERYQAHNPQLIAALEKMERALSAPISRHAMAGMLQVSARHLDRLFVDALAHTYGAWYRHIRLVHARLLLRQSTLSITEVGIASGFASSAYFSRCYRQAFGQSPRQTRQQ